MEGSVIIIMGSRITHLFDEHRSMWQLLRAEHIPEFTLESGDVCRIVISKSLKDVCGAVISKSLKIVVYRRGGRWVISDDALVDEQVVDLQTFEEVRAALRVMECADDPAKVFAALVARDLDVIAELNFYLSVGDADIWYPTDSTIPSVH
jgi:hypothetical protein